MQLYKIVKSIQKVFETPTGDVIDGETGEVFNKKYLDNLRIAKNRKIENIACWIKNLQAEIEAYKKEEENFRIRRKQAENRIENLKWYLTEWIPGEKIETPRVKISWRKSEVVNILDENLIPSGYKSQKITEVIDKKEIKRAIKSGMVVAGADIKVNENIQIK